MASTVLIKSKWLYVAITALGLAAFGLIERRMRRATRGWEGGRAASIRAAAPTYVALVGLLAYALVLAGAQTHVVNRRSAVVERQATVAERVVRSRIEALKRDTNRTEQVVRGLVRDQERIVHELSRLGEGRRLPAVGTRRDQRFERLIEKYGENRTRITGTLSEETTNKRAALRGLPRVDSVSPNALPAWFGHLREFFSLAAQILAGLVVALVLGRRVLRDRVSEQLMRTGTPLAIVGITAAVVGSLPDVHRGMQAFLLGYVIAGFGNALAALALLASNPTTSHEGQ